MYFVIKAEMKKGWEGCINGLVLAAQVVTHHLQLHFIKLFKTVCLHFPIILISSLYFKHPKKDHYLMALSGSVPD